MNQQDRIAKLLTLLEDRGKISQEELMAIFGISRDTARRDILKLVNSGLAERYPGGISRPVLKAQIETYSNRLIKHSKEKQRIAQGVAALLQSKMTIYLDVSTTVNFLAASLLENQLLVVTNSMDNALVVPQKESNQVYLLGGLFDGNSRLLAGEAVLQQLHQFNFDWAFIGGAGITEQGVFYSELADTQLKQAVCQNSQNVCLLIDSSKVNQQSPYKISFSGIDLIMTDKPLPLGLMEVIKAEKIELVIVKEGN